MFADVRRVFARYTTAELVKDLSDARIPWAEVNDVEAVSKLEALKGKLTRTRMPDGRVLNLQPLPVDGVAPPRELSFPPRYGEHTAAILGEIGFSKAEIGEMIAAGVAVQSELS